MRTALPLCCTPSVEQALAAFCVVTRLTSSGRAAVSGHHPARVICAMRDRGNIRDVAGLLVTATDKFAAGWMGAGRLLAARNGGLTVTTNQVLAGIGLILVLAVGSQILASSLRIPALIILLPAGFIAGAVTTDVNPQRLFGAAFQPLVSLSVAVILYDAGLGLDLRKLHGYTRSIVTRLIAVGVPVTWGFAAAIAALLLGMSKQAAVLTGAILVVSGPTVVGPLLSLVRPAEQLQRVLIWEGSLIDPIGGILGAVVYSAVLASAHRAVSYQIGEFLASIGVGVAGCHRHRRTVVPAVRHAARGNPRHEQSARLRGRRGRRVRHNTGRLRAHRRGSHGAGGGQHARF
jgi:hypothetical protein